jgi:hypothetical protein
MIFYDNMKKYFIFYNYFIMTKKDVYLLWWKDAEMLAIKETLKQQWAEFIDAELWWGANIDTYRAQIDELRKLGKTPVALELGGSSEIPWVVDIDHHGERASEPATILQVYQRLGLYPDLYAKLIAGNDSAYIPGMQKILDEEAITDTNVRNQMIQEIRALDRKAQWITPEMEIQAENAIQNMEHLLDIDLYIVSCEHSKTSCITDRLYGRQEKEHILILSGDGELNYYWDGQICQELKEKFEWWNGWSGLGKTWENAFWWGYPHQEEAKKFILDYFKENEK